MRCRVPVYVRISSLLVGIILLVAGSHALALTIAGNIPVTNTFDTGNDYAMANSIYASMKGMALQFTPADDVTIDLVEVAVSHGGTGNGFFVKIYTDDAGGVGSLISDLPHAIGGATAAIIGVAPIDTVALSAGANYWLVLRPRGQSENWNWSLPADSASGGNTMCLGYNTPGCGFNTWADFSGTRPAFRISGTVVPGPSPVLLLISGLAMLGGRRLARC